jgi:hypothetical protein
MSTIKDEAMQGNPPAVHFSLKTACTSLQNGHMPVRNTRREDRLLLKVKQPPV